MAAEPDSPRGLSWNRCDLSIDMGPPLEVHEGVVLVVTRQRLLSRQWVARAFRGTGGLIAELVVASMFTAPNTATLAADDGTIWRARRGGCSCD